MTQATTIFFYPKFLDFEEKERDEKIAAMREWLDQHGRYGKLYMMKIGKMSLTERQSRIMGVDIYERDIAVLFKLLFEV